MRIRNTVPNIRKLLAVAAMKDVFPTPFHWLNGLRTKNFWKMPSSLSYIWSLLPVKKGLVDGGTVFSKRRLQAPPCSASGYSGLNLMSVAWMKGGRGGFSPSSYRLAWIPSSSMMSESTSLSSSTWKASVFTAYTGTQQWGEILPVTKNANKCRIYYEEQN